MCAIVFSSIGITSFITTFCVSQESNNTNDSDNSGVLFTRDDSDNFDDSENSDNANDWWLEHFITFED